MTGSGTEDTGDCSTAVPAVDKVALSNIARRFHAQADDLRRRARRILLGVLVTVVGMTLVVVVLPPIINVAEDWVLARFGYQTSQYDFQRETARQAADVRARSQSLLELLQERDAIIDEMQEAVDQPLGAFAPEYIEVPDWAGRPIVYDMAENGSFQVAVGALANERDRASTPFIAYRRNATAPWTVWDEVARDATGGFFDAVPFRDGVLIAGDVDEFGALLLVRPDGSVAPPFPLELPGETVSDLAVSPDGSAIAIMSVLPGAPGEATVSSNTLLRVVASDGQGIWQQGVAGTAADLYWRGDSLFLLMSPGFGEMNLKIIRRAAESLVRPPLPARPPWELTPFGFVEDRVRDDEPRIFAANRGTEELYNASLFGDTDLALDIQLLGADLEGVTTAGDSAFALFDRVGVYGGHGSGTISRITPGDDEPEVIEVTLAARAYVAGSFRVEGFSNGRVRLSPTQGVPVTDPDAPRVMSFVEAEAPAFPRPAEDTSLLAFLEGLIDVGAEADDTAIGGDATAEAAGITDGRAAFAGSVAGIVELIEGTDMLLAADAFAGVERLNELADAWAAAWDERERSATILSRLRTADEAGSLWRNISSLAARLAVIALLIYLVNILVNLYRYNMRLAAFYQARGDAIDTALALGADLSGMAGTSLADLAKAHTPEEVTFGARPAAPTDAVLNAMTEVAKVAKRTA